MSDAAPAASPAPAKKTKVSKPKGEKKPKTAPSHPVYSAMIKAALKELKDRKGASKQAILKFMTQKYKLGTNEKQINAHLRMALKRGVSSGALTQPSGTGAAGRFRLAEKAAAPAASKPKKEKKPKAAGTPKKKAASKPKKAAGDKPKKAKIAKKSKSPKKAAAKPKKAKSPKKPAVKKAAKKPTAKKAAASKA
uniref:H15 domain-containing protein n=1 Tax=Haemonchus contortus TaxID=6289 RepID=A0A7I4YNA8_HAECO